MSQLPTIIEQAFENRANFTAADCPAEISTAVEEAISALDNGTLRVAEKIDGEFLWWVLYKGRNKAKRQHYQAIQKQYPEKVIVIKNQQQLTRFYQQQHMKLR